MQNVFSSSPWWTPQPGGVQGLGFSPGPVRVPIVNRNNPFDRPQTVQAAPPPPPPGVAQAPPGAIPLGKKGECPVCKRGPSGGF